MYSVACGKLPVTQNNLFCVLNCFMVDWKDLIDGILEGVEGTLNIVPAVD